ncbi:hypothetical protein KIPB_007656, partial [Kipferlia bialata]
PVLAATDVPPPPMPPGASQDSVRHREMDAQMETRMSQDRMAADRNRLDRQVPHALQEIPLPPPDVLVHPPAQLQGHELPQSHSSMQAQMRTQMQPQISMTQIQADIQAHMNHQEMVQSQLPVMTSVTSMPIRPPPMDLTSHLMQLRQSMSRIPDRGYESN